VTATIDTRTIRDLVDCDLSDYTASDTTLRELLTGVLHALVDKDDTIAGLRRELAFASTRNILHDADTAAILARLDVLPESKRSTVFTAYARMLIAGANDRVRDANNLVLLWRNTAASKDAVIAAARAALAAGDVQTATQTLQSSTPVPVASATDSYTADWHSDTPAFLTAEPQPPQHSDVSALTSLFADEPGLDTPQ